MKMSSAQDDQFGRWLDAVNAACGRYGATRLGEESQGAMRLHRQEAFELATIDVAQTRLHRRQQDVRGDDGKFFFIVAQLYGQARMEQASNRNVLQPGDLMLLDSARPSEFRYDGPSRQLSLIIPRELFSGVTRRGSIECGVKIPASSHLAQMTRVLIDEAACQSSLSWAESQAVLSAVVNLLGPLITACDSAGSSHQRAYERAIAFIERNLQLPELSPILIAKEVGVSLRGLYRCFAEHEVVVSQYIRNRRLDVCAELLRRSHDQTAIAELAYIWGFNEPSYFSTTFKARFNMTPSEYRQLYSNR